MPERRASVAGLAVKASGLGKRFSADIVALEGVELEIARAGITAVAGENGSGKSTLLCLAAGLCAPSAGGIEVLGVERPSTSPALRRRVGFVAQAPELDPEMTGSETLALFATLHGLSGTARRERISDLVGSFELGEYVDRPISSYSGGMRQRLHLAAGLVHDPELALLDEPTSALDPAGRRWFWRRLEDQRARGKTIVIVSHDLSEIADHCDELVILGRGRLLASAPPGEIVREHASFELELDLDGPPLAELAVERFSAVQGVARVAIRERRARLALRSSSADEAQRTARAVLDLIPALGLGVNGFRLRPPDLASAYFKLTGQEPVPALRRRAARRAELTSAS